MNKINYKTKIKEMSRERKSTSWRRAENVLATSCLGCPTTTSVKVMLPLSSASRDNLSKILSPYW